MRYGYSVTRGRAWAGKDASRRAAIRLVHARRSLRRAHRVSAATASSIPRCILTINQISMLSRLRLQRHPRRAALVNGRKRRLQPGAACIVALDGMVEQVVLRRDRRRAAERVRLRQDPVGRLAQRKIREDVARRSGDRLRLSQAEMEQQARLVLVAAPDKGQHERAKTSKRRLLT